MSLDLNEEAQADASATVPELPDLRHRYISLQTKLRHNRQLIRQRQEETRIYPAPRSSSSRDLPPLVLPPFLVPPITPAAPPAIAAPVAPAASVAPVAVPFFATVSATTIHPLLIGPNLPTPPLNVVPAPIAVAISAANLAVVPSVAVNSSVDVNSSFAVNSSVAVGPPPPLPGQATIPAAVWNDPTVRRFVLAPQGYQEYLDLARVRAAKPYYRASPGCCRLMRVLSAQIPSVGPIHGPNDPAPSYNAEASRNLGNLGNGDAYDVLARYRYDRLSAADRAFLDAFYP